MRGNPLLYQVTKKLYRNGENQSLADGLFNDNDSRFKLRKESVDHRRVIDLKLAGYSHRDIAALTGYTRLYVSAILRQPWARWRMIDEIKSESRDEFKRLLEEAGRSSIEKIIELRDNATSEQVQLSSAKELVDRWLGKPTEKVEHQVSEKKLDELDDAELIKLYENERSGRDIGAKSGPQ